MKAFPLRPLVFTVSLLTTGTVLAAPITVDLASQPLANALRQLGQASGLQVSNTSAAVAGKTAPAVRGQMEPAVALQAHYRRCWPGVIW